ncbi:hypothetical protein [Streptomyces sp. NPDC052494]|uniref:hypothetical protein n=1 Tax=Streptomyces sp. NPDC052494 TaxID=3365692 RepID=UPI0037CEDEE2
MFPADITVADMNGDAKPDVPISNTNGDNVSVWTNDGTGALGTASNYYVGGGRPSSYSARTAAPFRLEDRGCERRRQVRPMNSCPRARGGATATHRARFPALWSLLLTGLVLALVGAQAAPAPVPSPTPPESAASAPFGVQAGLYALTTLTGGHFGYALKAGARIEDSAVI